MPGLDVVGEVVMLEVVGVEVAPPVEVVVVVDVPVRTAPPSMTVTVLSPMLPTKTSPLPES